MWPKSGSALQWACYHPQTISTEAPKQAHNKRKYVTHGERPMIVMGLTHAESPNFTNHIQALAKQSRK